MTKETYNEYMKRLDAEYDEFRITVGSYSVDDILDNSEEIHNVARAYNCLRSYDLPDDQLVYIMQAMHPIREVAAVCVDRDASQIGEHYVTHAVDEICEKRMFDDPATMKYTDRVPIVFHRKISSLTEILQLPRNREDDAFVVEKIVELSSGDFAYFSKHLLNDMPFLPYSDERLETLKDGAWHCLLVHDAANNRGFLVDSAGYKYARYAAYVQDTRELDLQSIPVKKCALPSRKRQKKPKQLIMDR